MDRPLRPAHAAIATLAVLTLSITACTTSNSAAPTSSPPRAAASASPSADLEETEDPSEKELDSRLLAAREPLLTAGFEPLLGGALESGETMHVHDTGQITPGTYQITMNCMSDREAIVEVEAPEGVLEPQRLQCIVGDIATTRAQFQLGEGVGELEISR